MNLAFSPEIIADHGITLDEYQCIVEILGREPNITELGIFSVMWSEHCSYKNSKPLLKTFPTSGKHILQGPGENAGIVDFDENLAIVFKIESHNHPSALEPFQGAATGVGGILRDIFTMGARPIALLDPLRFGDPKDARTRRIITGVVEGIADYGNAVGVPTIGGECYFSPAYNANPLVNVMAVGVIEKDKITRAVASGSGNLVVYYGNATGRDGIHGATFASTELTGESEEKRSAVQVGDPFTEKKILEATLELIATQCVVAIQDMGAAGLTCSCAEMAGRGHMGIRIDLDKVPQRADNMSAYEMMLSESQERMLAICTPAQLPEVQQILDRWDLEANVLGEINSTGMMEVLHKGKVVANLPADKVSENSPVYTRHGTKPAYMDKLPDARQLSFDPANLEAELLEFLASPNICSKRWIYQQYDHMVQTQTVQEPGDNAAVLRVHGSRHHVAMSTDGNGLYCYLDPFEGGKLAVAEAARNVACTGARPLAVTNCLNFGNPTKPEIFYQLSEAVRGIGEACRALNTPVTGGNVSLYNENPSGAIWPTPIIGVVGRIEAPTKPVKAAFARSGLHLFLLGSPGENLGGSEYLRWKMETEYGPCPQCDLQHERNLIEVLVNSANAGLLECAQDCSVGGLFVSLAECVLLGNAGAEIDLSYGGALLCELLSETPGRVVVAISEQNVARFRELCDCDSVPLITLGMTMTELSLVIRGCDDRLEFSKTQLRAAYENTSAIFPPGQVAALAH